MDRAAMEALDRLIYCAFATESAPPLPDDVDPAILTEADLAALEALGTSEELARRVYDQFIKSQGPPTARTDRSTCTNELGATDTISDGPHVFGDPSPEFAEMLTRHTACLGVERFQWDYQFVKEQREIGQGGQGKVYSIRCENEFVGRRALKVLSPEPYRDAQAYLQEMERMRSVAAAVHQNCHDNLVHVERFEPHNGIYLMVMRLIDGFDLQRLLQDDLVENLHRSVDEERWLALNRYVFSPCGAGRRGLTPGVAVNIVEKCLRGVHALHEKQILHCDIKPSNIMLDCEGSIRLIDIGSAFQLGSRPRPHAWTPRYAPPEVLENEVLEDNAWTRQGDLASLGYVLIELLSGRPDLLGPSASSQSVHVLDKTTRTKLANAKRQLPDRLEQLIPVKVGESKRLMELCRTLIDPDPTKRFSSAEEAIDRTAGFRDELVVANLAMTWVKVIKYWVTDARHAMSKLG